jgi:hypothetical protein
MQKDTSLENASSPQVRRLTNLNFEDFRELVDRLATKNKTQASRDLTEYFATARFKLKHDEFDSHCVGGENDGGLDFAYKEDGTYYVLQTKFSENESRSSDKEIIHELRKIERTLVVNNPNRRAESFVADLKSSLQDVCSTLEIIWLTTKIVPEGVSETAQNETKKIKERHGWNIRVEFVPVDSKSLRAVIQDVLHGNIPFTGRKTLKLESSNYIENDDDSTGVYSIVAQVKVIEMLRWFGRTDVEKEVERFLQKNVRGTMGENDVNKGIVKSFADDPEWFWYRHNGIIVFADNVTLDKVRNELVLRNPQIVNGGQTVRSLLKDWNKSGRPDSPACVMLRVYRLPYEDVTAYEKGIDIRSALNSQTKIFVSDLRSCDPRQVRIESLIEQLDCGYTYYRKRSKEYKATKYGITMRQLALLYYTVKKEAPNLGLLGDIDDLFKERAKKYNVIFNEKEIGKEMSRSHVVLKYISTWAVDQIIQSMELNKIEENFRQYTRFYALVDVCALLDAWKTRKFSSGYSEWIEFLQSMEFKKAVEKYAKRSYRIARESIPKTKEARKYLRNPDASDKFMETISPKKFNSFMNHAYDNFSED